MTSSKNYIVSTALIGLPVLLTVALQLSPVPQIQRTARLSTDDYSARGEIRQSVSQLTTLLSFDPWSTSLRTQRAHAYLRLGDTQAARADFDTLFDQREILGNEALLLAATYLQAGDVAAADQILRDGIARSRLTEATAIETLDLASTQQDWWTASAALMAQSLLVPNDPEILGQLAVVQALDQPELARPTADQASALNTITKDKLADLSAYLQSSPTSDPVAQYARLGTIYASMGQFSIAETALTHAANGNPAYGEALSYLAYVRARLGKPSLGIMNQAVELAPQSPSTHFLAGLTWKALGRFVEARAAFERAYDLDPTNPSTAVEIASTHRAESASAYAETWMLESVRLSGGDLRFRILLAQFYVDDNYRVADAGFPLAQQLVVDAPDSAEAHDALGWAYFLLGALDRASEQLNRALALNPSLARAHTHLGALFEAQGNPASAINSYHRASELDPNGTFGVLARRALERLEP